jgi:flagellar motor protein MotB
MTPTAAGCSSGRPIFANDAAEGRARNRRVEIASARDGGAGNSIQPITPTV